MIHNSDTIRESREIEQREILLEGGRQNLLTQKQRHRDTEMRPPAPISIDPESPSPSLGQTIAHTIRGAFSPKESHCIASRGPPIIMTPLRRSRSIAPPLASFPHEVRSPNDQARTCCSTEKYSLPVTVLPSSSVIRLRIYSPNFPSERNRA